MHVVMRSYDAARSGANLKETILTPRKVGSRLLIKRFSLHFADDPALGDDPRLEAQPLYVSGMNMSDGKVHDVVYVCTMANNVWAFDANNGKPIWAKPTNLGRPITPRFTPDKDHPKATEIDMWGINIRWGILSTPVLDPQADRMYVVCWTSNDGTVANAIHELHTIDLKSGKQLGKVQINATAPSQQVAGKPLPAFVSNKQKQRASLLLIKSGVPAKRTVFIGFGMTHEDGDPTHGWVLVYDVEGDIPQQTAAWCTTPGGTGCGIWQGGQGPSADTNGDVYVMTGNYGVLEGGNTALPTAVDFPESFVKLHYTPPAGAGVGKLEPVAWFTPFRDHDRPSNDGSNDPHVDDFQDYDLGSAGPLFLTGLNLVIGAGKDGVLYVLPQDTGAFGKGSDFSRLKKPPIFFTYFPGFGIDASVTANLNILRDGKTHHQHCSPAFWDGGAGPMLFNWGENECLRAWKIDATGTATFVAKSAEIASAAEGGKGGMPGGILAVSSNGKIANTGIVWATVPLFHDANKEVVEGILRAYDASTLDPIGNADGTARLKLLWDSTHIPGNHFNFSKFCPPVVADGKIFVPTYDGRVDVYSMVVPKTRDPLPTNANM
jgi:outer membrane protein assembly factor BamB